MKKAALILLVALILGVSADAGETRQTLRQPEDLEGSISLFRDQEFQIDLSGSHTEIIRETLGHGFGGNGYLFRYFGLRLDGNLGAIGKREDPHFHRGRSLIFRFPLEHGEATAFVPDTFGGVPSNKTTVRSGLEYRAKPRIGLFGDARYLWGTAHNDAVKSRLGVRIAF
jgi:hypothetical protein